MWTAGRPSVCVRFLHFIPLCPHACKACVELSGNVDLSNMGMDCYNHWVITPTLFKHTHTQHTHCITWQFASPLFSLFNFSLSSPTMSLLGVTVCLCVSVETFDCFHFGGESFCCIFVLFYFVKLMIHIVLEPPATIKTVKSCSYSFILHFLLRWGTAMIVDKITTLPLQTLIFSRI